MRHPSTLSAAATRVPAPPPTARTGRPRRSPEATPRRTRAAGWRLRAALAALLALVPAAAAQSGTLTFDPIQGPVGTTVSATAKGLQPGTAVRLQWASADAQWNVADGRFLGLLAPETRTVVADAVVGADGRARFAFVVPEDYGYLHNTFLVGPDGAELARQGFMVVPEMTVTPTSGPPGTPITVRVTGIGYRFWESVWHLLYDGAHSGWLSAITTRGTAEVVLPATGPVGEHTLQILSGTHPVPYLNQQQAPIYKPQIPTVLGATFTVTDGEAVAPPAAASQGLARSGSARVAAGGARLSLSHGSGPVGSPFTVEGAGFAPGGEVTLQWSTVVGNRISGSGWEEALRDFATVTADADGAWRLDTVTPDDLGGVHRLVATSGDASLEIDYTLTPSVAEVTPQRVVPGGDITVVIKGVGWSETSNIYTLLMDNGYIGYGCGFNSQGDVTIHLKAPGAVGRHYIGLYPSIYQGELLGPGAPSSVSTANATYLQLPMLNAVDHPGERLPAFLLSFEVVPR